MEETSDGIQRSDKSVLEKIAGGEARMRLQAGSSHEERWSGGALGKAWSLNRVLRAAAWSASDYYWPAAEFQGQKQITV